MNDPIIGIDLGTSNTVVAYADGNGGARVLSDEAGLKIHPSVVSFHPSGGVVVGAAAKQRKVIDPKNTIFSIKRLIGRVWSAPEVQIAKQRMPYEIKEGQNQLPTVVTRGGEFAVPEISAIVLDYGRNVASGQLQTEVSRAVVTVPASFNDAQRSATATAGSIAGLTVVRVLNEPTAAALAYGHSRNLRSTIAVYDFGGGTFDITVLRLEDQVYEVLGTAGDSFLGGDDLDERLVDRMVEKFLTENRIDLRTNEVSMMRLRAVAEQTKIELSRRARAMVRVDEIAYGPKGKPLDLQIEITRDEFVRQVADIIDKTFPVCEEALRLAGRTTETIDDVILVGGTTKIPYVRDQVSRFFAKAPRTDVNPEEAVALGAALQATALEKILSRTSSRSQSHARVSPTQSDTATGPPLEDTDSSITMPAAEQPFPEATDEVELLTFEAEGRKARSTQDYPKRTGDRPVEKGRTIDRIQGAIPATVPAQTQPIGRMKSTGADLRKTAIGVQAPTDPAAPHPIRTAQSAPIPRPPGTPPPRPTGGGPASRQTGPAPVVPASRQTGPSPVVPPAPPGPASKPITIPPRVTDKSQPVPMPPRMTERSQPVPVPAGLGPPAVPVASPQARTLIVPPEDTADDITLQRGLEEPEVEPASTAKGFAPPQAYPVMAQAPAPAMAQTMLAPPPSRAPVVLDVTPRGLGIGTVAGYCEELIRRNARVPTEIRKLFTTSRDAQGSVRIIVCQGESRRLDDNVVIGDLRLENLPPRPRGETSIEVTFQLDASGILQVRARDAQTGAEQRASLDVVGTMAEGDVAASRDRLQQLRR